MSSYSEAQQKVWKLHPVWMSSIYQSCPNTNRKAVTYRKRSNNTNCPLKPRTFLSKMSDRPVIFFLHQILLSYVFQLKFIFLIYCWKCTNRGHSHSPSPVILGYPLGPGATKYSNSGKSAVSMLELSVGPDDRPLFPTLGGRPAGGGGAAEGIGVAPWSDILTIVWCAVRLGEERKQRQELATLSLSCWQYVIWFLISQNE